MYERAKSTFRERIAESGLAVNRETTLASQTIIRDALIDQAEQYSDKEFVIHDRCILDELVYSTLAQERPGSDVTEDFVATSSMIAGQIVKKYDIIFFFPVDDEHHAAFATPVQQRIVERDNDPEFRLQVNEVFRVLHQLNQNRTAVFDPNDSPPIIDLYGTVHEKIQLATLYVAPDGKMYDVGMDLVGEAKKLEEARQLIMPATQMPKFNKSKKRHK